MPVDQMFEDLGEIWLKAQNNYFAYNGNPFGNSHIAHRNPPKANITANRNSPEDSQFRVYDSRGNFIGVYHYDKETGRFRPEKMFLDPEQIR